MTEEAPALNPRALRSSPDLESLCSAWAQEILGLREPNRDEGFPTPWGDLNTILAQEERSSTERRLLGLALTVGTQFLIREHELTLKMAMSRFVELARSRKINALVVIDEVFRDQASELWQALPEPPRRPIGNVLVDGELLDPSRPFWLTAILTFSPFLVLRQSAALVGRWLLGYRNEARLRVIETGLELVYRRQLLGRVIREVMVLVPTNELGKVSREVRYRGALLYAGLGALILGSYLGVGMLLDGLRVPGGSLPLISTGVLTVLAGLGLDFLATTAFDSFRGRDRLRITHRSGHSFSLGNADPKDVETFLHHYQMGAPPEMLPLPQPTVPEPSAAPTTVL